MSKSIDVLKKHVFNISLILNCERSDEAKSIVQPILGKIKELYRDRKILRYTITEWPPDGKPKTTRHL